MSSRRNECKIYIGNLPPDVRTKDIESIFEKYGKVMSVELKDRGDPPFAFVEFDDPRDSEDAVRYRDGYDFDGYRLRVEHPRGNGPRPRGSGPPPWVRGDRGGGGGGGDRRFGGDRGGGGGGMSRGGGGAPYKRTGYRVSVTGLPPSGSWQDLKDHMREAGDVCYTDVFKDGTGIVEFLRQDDMKYALRKLDDTKFRSHEGELTHIRVKEDTSGDGGGGRGGGGRSRSRSRSRSPRSSPKKRRSPSYSSRSRRSPSYSAYRNRSGSGDRSRSRSPRRSRSRS